MEERYDCRPARWLRLLFFAHIASIVLFFNAWRIPEDLRPWAEPAMTLVAMLCLFCLRRENGRYQKAAIITGIGLVFTVLNELTGHRINTDALAAFLIFADYQEYYAHSMIILGRDSNLAVKWQKLFKLELIVGVLIVVLSLVMILVGSAGETGMAWILGAVTVILALVRLGTGILYLVYLFRTVRLMKEREYTI